MTAEYSMSRLLIVDDDPATIRVLGRMLQAFGEVRFAIDGEAAIRTIEAWNPDLVFLDAQMPEMDGFEVCRKVKANPRHADLPILFVTARTDIESEIAALDAGAVDFITKPLSPPIVRARIRTHLTLKQRTDELNRLAMVDGLTGIANRRRFDQLLHQECRRAYRTGASLSALLIDIDHFKSFNDLNGHEAGDACLRSVAKTLAGSARRPGEVLSRYGGEEFAIVTPACDLDQAVALGRKMCDAVRSLQVPHRGSPLGIVTVSIGAATLDRDQRAGIAMPTGQEGDARMAVLCTNSANGLIALADRALYAAKAAGRNRVLAVTERLAPPQGQYRAEAAS